MPTFKSRVEFNLRNADLATAFALAWELALEVAGELPGHIDLQSVHVRTKDNVEYEASDPATVFAEVRASRREIGRVYGGLRRNGSFDHDIWMHSWPGDKSLNIDLANTDEGWIAKTTARFNRERLAVERAKHQDTPQMHSAAIITAGSEQRRGSGVTGEIKRAWTAWSLGTKALVLVVAPIVVIVLGAVITNSLGLTAP